MVTWVPPALSSSANRRIRSSDSGVVLTALQHPARQVIFDGADQGRGLAAGAQHRIDQVSVVVLPLVPVMPVSDRRSSGLR